MEQVLYNLVYNAVSIYAFPGLSDYHTVDCVEIIAL